MRYLRMVANYTVTLSTVGIALAHVSHVFCMSASRVQIYIPTVPHVCIGSAYFCIPRHGMVGLCKSVLLQCNTSTASLGFGAFWVRPGQFGSSVGIAMLGFGGFRWIWAYFGCGSGQLVGSVGIAIFGFGGFRWILAPSGCGPGSRAAV